MGLSMPDPSFLVDLPTPGPDRVEARVPLQAFLARKADA